MGRFITWLSNNSKPDRFETVAKVSELTRVSERHKLSPDEADVDRMAQCLQLGIPHTGKL